MSVKSGSIPEGAMLGTYAAKSGCYTDCFFVDVPGPVNLSDFILNFFNTPVFRLERKLLNLFGSHPSTNDDVVNLASGAGDSLAIWKVEKRNNDQLIMAVGKGPIRSWLMVSPTEINANTSRIYFGSAVLPTSFDPSGEPKMDKLLHLLLGFHKLYSRILLGSAKRRLLKRGNR